jgi:hypothetical protein
MFAARPPQGLGHIHEPGDCAKQRKSRRLTLLSEAYDIFRSEIDGTLAWVGTRETFAQAREKVIKSLPLPTTHSSY